MKYVRSLFLGIVALLAVASTAIAAPTVTLTATPSSGVGVLNVTLAWTSGDSSTCVASGGWSGTKALNGSEVVVVSSTTSFALTCSQSTGSATVRWTPPTQNVDNTPLTNLANYHLFHATTAAGLLSATPVVVPAPASSHVLTGLPAGLRYFAARAVNSAGVASDLSNTDTHTVVPASAVANASVTVQQQPQPPTGLTVQATQARVIMNGNVTSLKAGTVPIGTECGKQVSGSWHRVDRDDVKLSTWGKFFYNNPIAARCA